MQRLGKKGEDKDRPIMCSFPTTKVKAKVLKAAREITRSKRSKKETPPTIKVSEDYSPEVRETRRKLTTILIEKKEEAASQNIEDFKCYLRHDKLVVNNDVFKLGDHGQLCKI